LQQRVASYEPSSWEGRRGSVPTPSPASPAITSPLLLPARNSFHSSSDPLSAYSWYVGLAPVRANHILVRITSAACLPLVSVGHHDVLCIIELSSLSSTIFWLFLHVVTSLQLICIFI